MWNLTPCRNFWLWECTTREKLQRSFRVVFDKAVCTKPCEKGQRQRRWGYVECKQRCLIVQFSLSPFLPLCVFPLACPQHANLVYVLGKAEPRIYLVAIYTNRRAERDTSILPSFSEVLSYLRLTELFSMLRTS